MGHGTEKQLYDAALIGDVTTFRQLLQQDPLLLDRVSLVYCPNTTPPLHIATLRGHLGIVKEVLKSNPQLAQQLDSQKSSPLHIAAAQGSFEIASLLLLAAPNMCWQRDCHSMNPVHIAAINGHGEILRQLVEKEPFPARERVDNRQTALHLCVKHGHLRALEVLVESLGELVREEDDERDTILHLAVRCRQIETVKYLVESNKIDKKSRNAKGETPLQILSESPDPDITTSQIREIVNYEEKLEKAARINLGDVIMVVVILIATMAFQAAVSPPGGVWPEDSSLHKAGEAVMASNHPHIYKHFVRANTVAFISSLLAIILLATKFPTTNDSVLVFTACMTWVSVASIAVSYGASVMVITP